MSNALMRLKQKKPLDHPTIYFYNGFVGNGVARKFFIIICMYINYVMYQGSALTLHVVARGNVRTVAGLNPKKNIFPLSQLWATGARMQD